LSERDGKTDDWIVLDVHQAPKDKQDWHGPYGKRTTLGTQGTSRMGVEQRAHGSQAPFVVLDPL